MGEDGSVLLLGCLPPESLLVRSLAVAARNDLADAAETRIPHYAEHRTYGGRSGQFTVVQPWPK